MSTAPRRQKVPESPRPSSSILLISPSNQILLLHRVQTSSAFPSAHVFPGGNLSVEHDGEIPDVNDRRRHEDGEAYQLCAIRECFEESGILLAKKVGSDGPLLQVGDERREEGRHAVHQNKVLFGNWLREQGGVPDTDGLVPFTRWITPTNIKRRYTTQMYLYFLPLASSPTERSLPTASEAVIPTPSPDDGIEHTAARFLSPALWLSLAIKGDIILFPPQFFLLHLIAPFLSPSSSSSDPLPNDELARQRARLLEFVEHGDPPWTEKCISPTQLMIRKSDGKTVLGLEKPGMEVEELGRRGDIERVVLMRGGKEGPTEVEVRMREELFREERGKL